jgi:hypothetical protein
VRENLIRSLETIIQQPLHSPEVKVVEITIQCCISILFLKALILLRLETLPEEVSDVSENY